MKKILIILFFASLFTTIVIFFSKQDYLSKHDDISFIEENGNTLPPYRFDRDSILSNGKYASEVRERGMINDAETAARIASAIAYYRYGERVKEETPYRVICCGDAWIVYGSTPAKYINNVNVIYEGTFHVTLNRYNAEIIKLWIG